jgi:hypothetical protein
MGTVGKHGLEGDRKALACAPVFMGLNFYEMNYDKWSTF